LPKKRKGKEKGKKPNKKGGSPPFYTPQGVLLFGKKKKKGPFFVERKGKRGGGEGVGLLCPRAKGADHFLLKEKEKTKKEGKKTKLRTVSLT